jgi:hypothetical protein
MVISLVLRQQFSLNLPGRTNDDKASAIHSILEYDLDGYTVVLHGPRLLLGDEYPCVVTVPWRRKRRVNMYPTTPYRVTPY